MNTIETIIDVTITDNKTVADGINTIVETNAKIWTALNDSAHTRTLNWGVILSGISAYTLGII